jgi:hypothetical protein
MRSAIVFEKFGDLTCSKTNIAYAPLISGASPLGEVWHGKLPGRGTNAACDVLALAEPKKGPATKIDKREGCPIDADPTVQS